MIKNFTNSQLWLGLIICIFLLDTGCQRKHLKQIAAPATVKRKYKKSTAVQQTTFSYVALKSKMEYTDGRTQFSATATIRIKRDSIIWISVTPLLGVEVLRAVIRTDSVLVLNKLDKEYYAFSISELAEQSHYPIDFNMAQSILLGNQPFSDTPDDSVVLLKDSVYELISQRRHPLLIENYIETQKNRLARLSIKETLKRDEMDINYENFIAVEGVLFPFINKISLSYLNKKGFQNTYIALEHTKVDPSDKDLKFPFSIPPKYTRRFFFE